MSMNFERMANELQENACDTLAIIAMLREVWNTRGTLDISIIRRASYVDDKLTALEVRGVINDIKREGTL